MGHKDTALDGLTKAERKALRQREADIMAELEARAAAKPVKPKSKAPDLSGLKRKALKQLIADETNGGTLRDAARAELSRRAGETISDMALTVAPHEDDDTDAQIAARAKVKRAPRAAAAAEPPAEDETTVKTTGEPPAERIEFLRGVVADLENNSQRTRELARRELDLIAVSTSLTAGSGVGSARAEDALDGEGEVDYQWRKQRERQVADVVAADDESTVRIHVAEEVETETGRLFEVGAPLDETLIVVDHFGKPSEAPQPLTLEEGRNGYKIMSLKDDGTPDPRTVRQFTRVTTYIDNLEDKTNLEKWKLRTLLEGVALSDTPDDRGRVDDPAVMRVRELMHTRDRALAKAAKADRKGELEVGELAVIENAAVKAFKDALNAMASDLLELGGVHEKANRGTNLHALAELYDADGIAPIDAKLESGEITPTDHASIVAYGEALTAAGVKVVASEVVVVNDELRYAGRLDRIVLARRPGDQRASRVIADIKSGRLDYGLAKVEQQVALYADGHAYDLATGVRTPHGAVRSWGLVIHLPQGEGTCTVHVLDLARGRKANALSARVRAHRSEAGRMRLGPDLAKPAGAEAVS